MAPFSKPHPLDRIAAEADHTPLATQLFPLPTRPLTLHGLLEPGAAGEPSPVAAAWHRAFTACRLAEALGQTPIIGVCGAMNSGKSTIVASFLSAAGRGRVLTGEGRASGTHRFVFWLPAAWQGGAMERGITELIRNAVGETPEPLADDPDQAAAQYNARRDRVRDFYIPLVAFDAGLDAAGCAFLDCPDIQRALDETSAELTAPRRMGQLHKLARACSAFIVVTSLQQAGSEDLRRIFEALRENAPSAPRYFVLNMTPPENTAAENLQEAGHALKLAQAGPVRRIYGAPKVRLAAANPDAKPEMVSLEENAAATDAKPLTALVGELDAAELQALHFQSSAGNLLASLRELRRQTDADFAAALEPLGNVRQAVLGFFAAKFVTREGRLRMPFADHAARQFNASFLRTAPLPVRMAQKLTGGAAFLVGTAKKGFAILRGQAGWGSLFASAPAGAFDPASQDSGEARPRWKKDDFLDDHEFAQAVRGQRGLPPETADGQLSATLTALWQAAWQAAGRVADPAIRDEKTLDEKTHAIWAEMPKAARLKAYFYLCATGVSLTVAGVLSLIDPTQLSTVAWLKGSALLTGGQWLSLILGGGSGVRLLTTLASMHELEELLEREVTLPQLARLYAGVMDGLGLPRRCVEAPTPGEPEGPAPALERSFASRDEAADLHATPVRFALPAAPMDALPLLPALLPLLPGPLRRVEPGPWAAIEGSIESLAS